MSNKTEFENGYDEGANNTAELFNDVLAELLYNQQQNGALTAAQALLIALEMGVAVKRLKEKESEV
ncbi:hypothetical protein [Listeria seeligeri]|uniref:hypothetical protein n=1 Tax=Listeria seeligeri TaxID=1640 RepID=UPI00162A1B37|nr:hypothetical protein [Listeria seeligeri]MBC1934604.1 hypothetical protein [Listeria seeligeri]